MDPMPMPTLPPRAAASPLPPPDAAASVPAAPDGPSLPQLGSPTVGRTPNVPPSEPSADARTTTAATDGSRRVAPERRGHRIAPILVGATLVVAIGAVATIGVRSWRAGSETGDVPAGSSSAADAAPPIESVPPFVGRLEDLVADIDDNSEEAIALDLLGIEPLAPFDSSGSIAAADVADGVVASSDVIGHSFRRELPDGRLIVAWVATAGGDADVDVDGMRWRRSDGSWWSTVGSPTDPATAWTAGGGPPIDPLVDAALGRLPTADLLLPGPVRTFAVLDATEPGDWTIDDIAFAASDPSGRSAWFRLWGLDPTQSPGTLTVVLRTAPDGTVVDMSVASPSDGWVSVYRLVDVATGARTIPAPG